MHVQLKGPIFACAAHHFRREIHRSQMQIWRCAQGNRTAEFIHATHQIKYMRGVSELYIFYGLMTPARAKSKRRNEIYQSIGSRHLVEECANGNWFVEVLSWH